ncbi:50S ribosomal protein L33 [Pueribacillus sp. YX66]
MRTKVILACSNCESRNYSTVKNKQSDASRLSIKKFCKICNAHTVHKETK